MSRDSSAVILTQPFLQVIELLALLSGRGLLADRSLHAHLNKDGWATVTGFISA
jgi:hypothetical protein